MIELTDKLEDWLSRRTSKVHKVPIDEARIRVKTLIACGILNGFDPETPAGQHVIDSFLSVPTSEYENLKIPKI